MSSMPQPVDSERIMAQAQSMVGEASEGLAQLQQAWDAFGVNLQRIASAHDAAIARGAPGWLAPTQRVATANDMVATALNHHDTRRARKHRNLV